MEYTLRYAHIFAKPIDDIWLHGHNIKSNVEEIRSDSETNKIVTIMRKKKY